ncbi:MAG: DEAD/DEAH box helicase, partial [Pseudomonadota bacterium]
MKNEENDQQPTPEPPARPPMPAAEAPANPEEQAGQPEAHEAPGEPGAALDDDPEGAPDDDTEEDSEEDSEEDPEGDATDDQGPGPDGLPIATAPSDYSSDRAFRDFPLSEETLRGLNELGYQQATPVQVAAIEPGLAGRDLLVRAKTGTGKTAAFGIPIVERVEPGSRKVGAVVLTPTRELALQVAEELTGIGRYKDIRVCTLYGGVAIGPQTDALKGGVEVVVGTPGRILDHLRRRNLDLSEARMACIDEADEMLSMGFLEDVTRILAALPKDPKPQVLLFSATVQEKVKGLVRRFLKDPVSLMLSTDADRVEGIRHVLYETDINVHKIRSLLAVLDREQPTSALIFANTREDTTTVANFLSRQGLDAEHISGDLPQSRREVAMRRLKQGRIQYLVATDVAARGIDISDLSHVLHYSLPEDPAVYLHRSGRTGRIGKSGVSIAIAGGTDLSTRLVLERQYGIQFEVLPVPTPEEAGKLRLEAQVGTLKRAMGSCAFEGYLGTVRALKEHPEGDLLLAVALRTFFGWERERLAAEVEAAEQAAPAGEAPPPPQDGPADGGRSRRGGSGGGGG